MANIDEIRQDRSADRDAIQAQMDEYLRHGGLISKLDWAGNVVGLETEAPKGIRPVPKGMNFNPPINRDRDRGPKLAPTVEIAPAVVTLKPRPAPSTPKAETAAEWCERVAPTATIIDIVPELRRIRADAERALARLNAAVEKQSA